MKLNAIDKCILAIINGQKLYALLFLDKINMKGVSNSGFATLYPSLNRLEKQGFISWQ